MAPRYDDDDDDDDEDNDEVMFKQLHESAGKVVMSLTKIAATCTKILESTEEVNRDNVPKLIHTIDKCLAESESLSDWGQRMQVIPSKPAKKKAKKSE